MPLPQSRGACAQVLGQRLRICRHGGLCALKHGALARRQQLGRGRDLDSVLVGARGQFLLAQLLVKRALGQNRYEGISVNGEGAVDGGERGQGIAQQAVRKRDVEGISS